MYLKNTVEIDPVERIVSGFNVVQLNRSANELLKSEKMVLDHFAQKFPSMIIFIFSVIDTPRKKILMKKLSEKTFCNLISEELRMLVLREIGKCTPDMDLFTSLLEILDSLEESKFINMTIS